VSADRLPIHEVLPALKAALSEHNRAILVAAPGAGKTTVTPLALLGEPWLGAGKVLVLEPRRLAARGAAARMAAGLGESVGQTVGLRVRFETKVSGQTRIEVITDGVFSRMIQDDPGLEGVGAVLFDEFHERGLESDLGLAFAHDSQQVLREDLRLLVMSATLDDVRISSLLGEAPVIQSDGRAHPIQTRYLGKDPTVPLELLMARTIERALRAETGGILAFLPGQGEILRTERHLRERVDLDGVDVHPLYGALDLADQDRAVAPAPVGRRKVVLATAIAQTSLTLEGVRVVIDSGLTRAPRWEPRAGLTRLVTVRASRATADQRRGRAGRLEPGVCWRLWDEPETRSLPAFERPEILESDLTRLALDLALWGDPTGASLALLDRPPAAALDQARRTLSELAALDDAGAPTKTGRAIARLPLPPRLAHMILQGAASGQASLAARIAALITEPGLGGRAVELADRLERFVADRGPRARAALNMAQRWSELAPAASKAAPAEPGALLAAAFPDRIAKARGAVGEFQLSTGRGVYLDPASPLARESWLAVAELSGGATRDRILLAAPLSMSGLMHAAGGALRKERVRVETASGPRMQSVARLGELIVEEGPLERIDAETRDELLLADLREQGPSALGWSGAPGRLRERLAFLRAQGAEWPDVSDPGLAACFDAWAPALVTGAASLGGISSHRLVEALLGLIPWNLQADFASKAPQRWTAPTGSSFDIDYAAEGGPRVAVRVQEVYGLGEHPLIGRDIPLTLALLSPAHREIQVTRDLPAFWRGTWREVRKEMRGRYPRHLWPEDPASATPTTRAKPRGQ